MDDFKRSVYTQYRREMESNRYHRRGKDKGVYLFPVGSFPVELTVS